MRCGSACMSAGEPMYQVVLERPCVSGIDRPRWSSRVLAARRDPIVRPCGHRHAGAADRRGGHGDHGDRRVPVSAVLRCEDDLWAGRMVLSREDRDGQPVDVMVTVMGRVVSLDTVRLTLRPPWRVRT